MTAIAKDKSETDECLHNMSNLDIHGNIDCQRQEFDWKLDNFSSLSEAVDDRYVSPSFYFRGRSWYLKFYPNGERQHQTEGYVGVYLCLADSGAPLEIQFSLSIKTVTGETEVFYDLTRIFKKKKRGWGVPECILRSELLRRRDELISNDSLTVTATLKMLNYISTKNGTKNVSLQTDVEHVAADGSVQTAVQNKVADDGVDRPTRKTGREKVLEDIGKMWRNGDNSDVILKVQDVEFKAHRNILAARTPVLCAMFQHDTVERASGELTIEDCEPAVFEQLLNYIYTGAPSVLNAENASALYVLADKYLVNEVKALCVRCMQDTLCVDTFCRTAALSLMHGEQKLLEMVIDFFSKNMLRVIKTVEWQVFLREHSTWANEFLIRSMELIEARNEQMLMRLMPNQS